MMSGFQSTFPWRRLLVLAALLIGIVASVTLWRTWLTVPPFEGMELVSADEIRAGCPDDRLMGHLAGLIFATSGPVDGTLLPEEVRPLWIAIRFESGVTGTGFAEAYRPNAPGAPPSLGQAADAYRRMDCTAMAELCLEAQAQLSMLHQAVSVLTNEGTAMDQQGPVTSAPVTTANVTPPLGKQEFNEIATARESLAASDQGFAALLPATCERRQAYAVEHADLISP